MKKIIIFGVLFAVFLILMIPVTSAVESQVVENNQLIKITLEEINKIKKSIMEKLPIIPPPEPTIIVISYVIAMFLLGILMILGLVFRIIRS
jgi:hypothetical protein